MLQTAPARAEASLGAPQDIAAPREQAIVDVPPPPENAPDPAGQALAAGEPAVLAATFAPRALADIRPLSDANAPEDAETPEPAASPAALAPPHAGAGPAPLEGPSSAPTPALDLRAVATPDAPQTEMSPDLPDAPDPPADPAESLAAPPEASGLAAFYPKSAPRPVFPANTAAAFAPTPAFAPRSMTAPTSLTEPAPAFDLVALRQRARKPAGAMILKTGVQDFSFYLPGDIIKGTSSTGGARGALDDSIHAPWIRFPLEEGPAYVNSQVWGWGGLYGRGGGECDRRNYSYPWRDNFCESRSRISGACPGGVGHQGVDIRPSSCDDEKHWAVAVEDGFIIHIGGYGITLRGDSGYEYRYLHVSTELAAVRRGQRVRSGDRIALVSNLFDGTPTSIHLHFEMRRPNGDGGLELVSPYASLIPAYLELLTGDKAKAEAALDAAIAAPRPKQPPPFTGVAGKGSRRKTVQNVVKKGELDDPWCDFAPMRRGSTLRGREFGGFGGGRRGGRSGC